MNNPQLVRRTSAIALLAILTVSLISVPGMGTQEAQARDKREVAVDTIGRVIEGLKKVREFLSTTKDLPEVLSAIDAAVKNLEATVQILKETGDVKAAEASLKSSSRNSEAVTKAAPKEDRTEENERLQQAIKRARERARELAEDVAKLESTTLRSRLMAEIDRARSILDEALDAVKKGDTERAAQLLGDARKILGNVNSEIAAARTEEKTGKLKEQFTERVQKQISELKRQIIELEKKISKSSLPDTLSKELFEKLGEARNLLNEADAAAAKGNIDPSISNIGKALAIVNQVEARLKVLLKETEKINESIEEVEEKIDETRKEAQKRNLPNSTMVKVNQLLDEASSLLKKAKEAVAKGSFSEAHSFVAKAQGSVNQAESVVRSGQKGRAESKEMKVEVEAEIEGNTIKVEIENEGGQAITITDLKLRDTDGKEVKVDWTRNCKVTLDAEEELKCRGRGEFKASQTYQLIVAVKRADAADISEIKVQVAVEGKEEDLEKTKEKLKGDLKVEAEVEIEGRSIEAEVKNRSDQTLTIKTIKILDKSGKEVSINWKTECVKTLGKGQEVRCSGRGEFKEQESYRAIIEVQMGSSTFTFEVSAKAED